MTPNVNENQAQVSIIVLLFDWKKVLFFNLEALIGLVQPASIAQQRFPTTTIQNFSETKLCEYLIATYSNEGEVVLDPIMKSGTIKAASLALGRSFIGVRFSEKG